MDHVRNCKREKLPRIEKKNDKCIQINSGLLNEDKI